MALKKINGLDLKTDNAILEICKVSNSSSGNTRSVLYVLVVVCILSCAAVINTTEGNWAEERIAKTDNIIHTLTNKLFLIKNTNDSLNYKHSIDSAKKAFEFLLNNQITNYKTVRMPLLGNAFDINDLSFVSGVMIISLMIVLLFTLRRENNNLRIALFAITERYPKDANEDVFKIYLDENEIKEDPENTRDKILEFINKIRREHNYNFLCMNEVFNLPPIRKGDTEFAASKSGLLVAKMFYFPSVVFGFIMANDFWTAYKGFSISEWHAIVSLALGLICLLMISYLSYKCTNQKAKIFEAYKMFWGNEYTFKAD